MSALPKADNRPWIELPDGRAHQIETGCTIGRLGSCDLILHNEGVSREHAKIGRQGKLGYAISDMGSKNGTFVNGVRIGGVVSLCDRDMIEVGDCWLRFHAGSDEGVLETKAVSHEAQIKRRTVLIAAERSLASDGLLELIGSKPDLKVAACASDAKQVRQMHATLRPEAVLLDASFDGAGSLSLLADLISADADSRIAMLIERPDPDYIHRVLRRGALACVLKSDPTEELIRALQSVLTGSVYLSRRIAAVAVRQLAGSEEAGRRGGPIGLTDRELEIFHLVAGAKANREIAAILGMSVKTVETHKENIKVKLGVASTTELAEKAREWLAR
jgi:two-component system NarL family response regulator